MTNQTIENPDRAASTGVDGATDGADSAGVDAPNGVDRSPAASSLGARVAPDELLAPGAVIARFIVHRALGAGGAGVVYAAHDPELDRTIALKILRREVAERADARARFLREAQALARLSHPNVIAVYDVGATRGCTFIAMEYIHGRTFADWTAASARSWSEIVAVLVKAGRGLAAAHTAGLIHRDFKPTNLLVGDDGRVVVTDFGLARAMEAVADEAAELEAGSSPSLQSSTLASTLAVSITRTGAVQGTPAYMAPEQQEGQAADARADQFSFCVTLYEALFGTHPFLPQLPSSPASRSSPSSPPSAARELGTAACIPVDDRGVPVWLQRAVLRGLGERPEDRYLSMDGLLAALNHEPIRRRRRVRLAVAAAAVAIVGAGITTYAITSGPAVPLCAGAADKLAGTWSLGSRAELRSAFAATRLPYAADAWRRVEPILDAYVTQWTAMHSDACQATRVRGEQSELLMDRRMACLDVRRRELDQLTRLLVQPDADVVEHAVQAAHGLSRIQDCGDLAALTRTIAAPPDPVTAARVTTVRQKLAAARVLNDAGKYADGLALVDRLATEQVTRDYLPLRAEVSYATGRLDTSNNEWDRARTHLEDAIWAAEASGHDAIAMASLSGEVAVLAELDRFKEAHDMIHRGEAALLRIAAPPLVLAEFRNDVCHALDREGRYVEAHDQCQQALELRRRELGPDHPDVAFSLYRLGELANRHEHSESPEQALGYFRDALAIQDKTLGPEHPELSRTLTAMANAELHLGRMDDAMDHDRRALVIAERAVGPDSMRLFTVLLSLGDVLWRRQRNAEAIDVVRRALAIIEKAVGPEHSQAAMAHLRLADVLQAQNDYSAALQHYRLAASIFEATVGTAHPNYAIVVLDICSMELELKRPREALPDCTRGLAALEHALGHDAPAVADALVGMIDRVYAANGMTREALAALERGIASWPKGDPTAAPKIADGELTLAQTIWAASPRERARARTIATRARDRLRDAGAGHQAQHDAAAAWLATHAGS